MSDRCPKCGGVVQGIRRGQFWLERALAVHAETCPGVIRVRHG